MMVVETVVAFFTSKASGDGNCDNNKQIYYLKATEATT